MQVARDQCGKWVLRARGVQCEVQPRAVLQQMCHRVSPPSDVTASLSLGGASREATLEKTSPCAHEKSVNSL